MKHTYAGTYVTGFMKTGPNDTRNDIQFTV